MRASSERVIRLALLLFLFSGLCRIATGDGSVVSLRPVLLADSFLLFLRIQGPAWEPGPGCPGGVTLTGSLDESDSILLALTEQGNLDVSLDEDSSALLPSHVVWIPNHLNAVSEPELAAEAESLILSQLDAAKRARKDGKESDAKDRGFLEALGSLLAADAQDSPRPKGEDTTRLVLAWETSEASGDQSSETLISLRWRSCGPELELHPLELLHSFLFPAPSCAPSAPVGKSTEAPPPSRAGELSTTLVDPSFLQVRNQMGSPGEPDALDKAMEIGWRLARRYYGAAGGLWGEGNAPGSVEGNAQGRGAGEEEEGAGARWERYAPPVPQGAVPELSMIEVEAALRGEHRIGVSTGFILMAIVEGMFPKAIKKAVEKLQTMCEKHLLPLLSKVLSFGLPQVPDPSELQRQLDDEVRRKEVAVQQAQAKASEAAALSSGSLLEASESRDLLLELGITAGPGGPKEKKRGQMANALGDDLLAATPKLAEMIVERLASTLSADLHQTIAGSGIRDVNPAVESSLLKLLSESLEKVVSRVVSETLTVDPAVSPRPASSSSASATPKKSPGSSQKTSGSLLEQQNPQPPPPPPGSSEKPAEGSSEGPAEGAEGGSPGRHSGAQDYRSGGVLQQALITRLHEMLSRTLTPVISGALSQTLVRTLKESGMEP